MNNKLTVDNWRSSSLFVPALFGVVFVSTILTLAILIENPTEFQFQVFKTILALAGGAFAATLTGSLEVYIPIVSKGFVKAGMGFGVFVLLFFFSPASLVVDSSKLQSAEYRNEYRDSKSEVFNASRRLNEIWTSPESQKIIQRSMNPSEKILSDVDLYIRSKTLVEGSGSDFYILLRYFDSIVNCVNSRRCEISDVCDTFAADIESFRQFYCGLIDEYDLQMGDDLAKRLDDFSVDICRYQFISKYVDFKNRQFDATCIPVQCWAKNKTPPYPCQVRRQFSAGIVVPGRL